MPESKRSSTMYNQALTDAIKEIYRIYGPNLSAFFRDIEESKGNATCGRGLHGHLAEIQPRKRIDVHTTR